MAEVMDNCGLEDGGNVSDGEKEINEIFETYQHINGHVANYGSFRHGTITEMVRPTDPSQALI